MPTINIPKDIYDSMKSQGLTEVEKGEYLQTPDGATMEVVGKRHSDGGEIMNLPGGTKVISDYLTIGAKNATFFKKEFGLNVKATNKFATVLDKYKKKIGLTELLEDEVKLMKKLEKQEEVEFEGTREINLEVLSQKIQEIQPEKEQMEVRFEEFTNIVFDKQEETKEPGGSNFKKQEGGEISELIIDENGQPVPQEGQEQPQEGGSEIEQIIMAFCEMTGQDPAQVVQELQQLPEDQIQQAIEQMVQAIRQGQPQQEIGQPQEGQPMMRNGGYMQPGGSVPFDGSDNVQQGNFVDNSPRKISQNGQDYYVYGQGNDTRMVPVSAVESQYEIRGQQVDSPYKTGEWDGEEYSSKYQQDLKKQVQARYDSDPTDYKSVSSDEAKRIQQVLVDSGYSVGNAGIDGKIGSDTLAAAKQMRLEDPETYKSWINIDLPENEIKEAVIPQGKAIEIIKNNQTKNTTPVQRNSRPTQPVSKSVPQQIAQTPVRKRVNRFNIDEYVNEGQGGTPLRRDPIGEALLSTLTLGASSLLPGSVKMVETRGKEGKMKTFTGLMDALPLAGPAISKAFSSQSGLNGIKDIITAGSGINHATKMKYAEKLVQVANSTKTPLTKSQLNMVNIAESFLKGNKTTRQLPFMNTAKGSMRNPFLEPYMVNKTLQLNDNFRNYKQDGGYINYAKEGMSINDFDNLRKNYKWDADYEYGDIGNQSARLKPILDRLNIKYTDEQLSTQQGQDALAGQAQTRFRSDYNKTSNHYSSMVAPTQTGLQTALDNKLLSEKELTDLGVKVSNGKVLRGSKGILPKENESKLIETINKNKVNNAEGYEKYVDTNFTDNKWYYRFADVQDVNFANEKERDNYIKDNNFELTEDANGKKIYYSNTQGLYFNPLLNTVAKTEEAASNPQKAKDPSGDIDAMGNKDRNWDDSLPMLTPDQSNMRPNLLQPGLRTFGHVQSNAINVSPEETLKELNKQYNTASRLASETNPYTSGAMQADLQAKSNDAINQAYSQAAVINAQDQRNVENTNEGRIQQRENSNIGALNNYEELSQRALDNYGQSWRNYYENQNKQNVGNFNLENQRQAFNATNDNFKIGAMGWSQTGETPVIKLPSGMMAMKDPATGEYHEVKTVKDENGNIKTITEKSGTKPPRKQKGGLLLSKGIKTYLK